MARSWRFHRFTIKKYLFKKVKQKVVWCWWAVGLWALFNCSSVGMSCNLLYLLAFFRQYKYVGLGLCRYMIFSCKCMIFSAKSLIFPQDFHGKELSRALLGHLEDFPKGATAQPHDKQLSSQKNCQQKSEKSAWTTPSAMHKITKKNSPWGQVLRQEAMPEYGNSVVPLRLGCYLSRSCPAYGKRHDGLFYSWWLQSHKLM